MIELLESTLRLSTPLLFAALGGFLCERSGIATICLEGVMITSAWTAAVVNYYTHSPMIALGAAMLVGGLTMSLHAFLVVTARADQIVSGVAVNILAAGITPVLTKAFFGSPTNTAAILVEDRFQAITVPFLSDLPGVGFLFHQMPLVYLALLLPFGIHFLVYRTGLGLRLLASGDGPDALRTAGVSPEKVRYVSLFVGGIVTSLGGAYLSISHASQFTRDMTSGRGFIALAALIFGKWKPLPTLLACLFFGFADASQIRLQSVEIAGTTFPVQFIQAFPYFVTLIVLIGFMGSAKPPLSIGKKIR